MFFIRMIARSFTRQLKRRLLIALTVCLSATVSVAMLGVVFDVGDKLNAELSTYGSNIVVQPKASAVVSDLYNTSGDSTDNSSDPTTFLKESDAAKIKTIFWAFNITNFAPELNIHADVDCSDGSGDATDSADSVDSCKATSVPIVGTWFAKQLHMDSGESAVAGMRGMRSWWKLEGSWPKDDSTQGLVGKKLAAKLGVGVGGTVTLNKTNASGARNVQKITVTGIYESGDSDDDAMYIPSAAAQQLSDLPDSIDKIEVKALTTPDNDLARKAAKNPAALTQDEWETWYCTAYPSSIAYQIEDVIDGAVAKQVRQVAALQGDVLRKTQAVMVLMTVLSLVAAAIAVANLMAASIGERGSELALLKAIGASDGAVSRLMLAETAMISLIGAIAGALLGSGVAQIVGRVVFDSGITMRPMVFVLVFVLLALTVLVASFSSIRAILNLRPAEVLHGR
ncbi:ABC transporter permease [Bifidobacterium panos]|uniref:ABC transporter permease n=1 Tax=Bifidobacterium panos TaxID=2675321 RepID=A0ABX1SX36_9BIFI|nr:FtsX-like permease family protein [Bifidobacterium sp. DSM 109963]NMN02391.1 ABC transporter permease [Bifidobacterium sp. DSM 109963]